MDLIYGLMLLWAIVIVVGIIIALMPIILAILGALLCFGVITLIASVLGFAFF